MKKWVIAILSIIIVILLIAFFWPKSCGDFAGVYEDGQVSKSCTCMGIKYHDPTGKPGVFNLNRAYTDICWGIPTKFSCTRVNIIDNEPTFTPISCTS